MYILRNLESAILKSPFSRVEVLCGLWLWCLEERGLCISGSSSLCSESGILCMCLKYLVLQSLSLVSVFIYRYSKLCSRFSKFLTK